MIIFWSVVLALLVVVMERCVAMGEQKEEGREGGREGGRKREQKKKKKKLFKDRLKGEKKRKRSRRRRRRRRGGKETQRQIPLFCFQMLALIRCVGSGVASRTNQRIKQNERA